MNLQVVFTPTLEAPPFYEHNLNPKSKPRVQIEFVDPPPPLRSFLNHKP